MGVVWMALVIAVLFAVAFCCGFAFAVFCYPDKQEIIDRVKRDRDG